MARHLSESVCCHSVARIIFAGASGRITMDQPRELCPKPPTPPPASPWMASSKMHWLWLARKYEDQLLIYRNDMDKNKLIEQLQKRIAEEKSGREHAEKTISNYKHAHKRLVNFVVKELVLPPPPPRPEPGPQKAPICVPDDDAATGQGAAPPKRPRISATRRPTLAA